MVPPVIVGVTVPVNKPGTPDAVSFTNTVSCMVAETVRDVAVSVNTPLPLIVLAVVVSSHNKAKKQPQGQSNLKCASVSTTAGASGGSVPAMRPDAVVSAAATTPVSV